jgi:hypothetical protein
MKVGDRVADKEYPDVLGVIFKIDWSKKHPYYVFTTEGEVQQLDQEYMDEYGVLVHEE